MRILQVLKPYTKTEDLQSIGYAVASMDLVNALSKNGHEIDIVSNAEIEGYNTIKVPVKRAEYVEMCKVINSVKKNYDIIHIQLASFTGLQSIVKYLDKDIKLVITFHMSSDLGRNLFLNANNIKTLLEEGKKLVCVSNTTGRIPIKKFIGDISDNISVIPNIVKIPDNVLEEDYDKEYDVIIVGRLTPSKRTQEAILFCIHNNLKTLVIGKSCHESDNEYASICLDYIQRAGIDYIESCDRVNLLKYIKKSRVMLSLTESESFGLTLVESVMVGTPVITMNLPVSYEVLGELSNDIPKDLVYRKSWKTKFNVIKSYYDNLKNVKLDGSSLSDRYSSEAVVSSYEEVYNELMRGE